MHKGYTYLRRPIINPFLRSFWRMNQLYTIGGLQGMENHRIFFVITSQKAKNCIFKALPFVWGVEISKNTYNKSSLAIILTGPPTLYDQRFMRYGFWAILGGFSIQFCPKKWVSSTFRPDHQVNPENRPSKDYKSTAVSELPVIGRSPPSSTSL